jgi:hypothetical protein
MLSRNEIIYRNLKPEWWGAPLVQEKYQGERKPVIRDGGDK